MTAPEIMVTLTLVDGADLLDIKQLPRRFLTLPAAAQIAAALRADQENPYALNLAAGIDTAVAEARALAWLAARTPKIATLTERGFITLPSLSLANAASMIELSGFAVWEYLTEDEKAVLMARNVVFREPQVKPV